MTHIKIYDSFCNLWLYPQLSPHYSLPTSLFLSPPFHSWFFSFQFCLMAETPLQWTQSIQSPAWAKTSPLSYIQKLCTPISVPLCPYALQNVHNNFMFPKSFTITFNRFTSQFLATVTSSTVEVAVIKLLDYTSPNASPHVLLSSVSHCPRVDIVASSLTGRS